MCSIPPSWMPPRTRSKFSPSSTSRPPCVPRVVRDRSERGSRTAHPSGRAPNACTVPWGVNQKMMRLAACRCTHTSRRTSKRANRGSDQRGPRGPQQLSSSELLGGLGFGTDTPTVDGQEMRSGQHRARRDRRASRMSPRAHSDSGTRAHFAPPARGWSNPGRALGLAALLLGSSAASTSASEGLRVMLVRRRIASWSRGRGSEAWTSGVRLEVVHRSAAAQSLHDRNGFAALARTRGRLHRADRAGAARWPRGPCTTRGDAAFGGGPACARAGGSASRARPSSRPRRSCCAAS